MVRMANQACRENEVFQDQPDPEESQVSKDIKDILVYLVQRVIVGLQDLLA